MTRTRWRLAALATAAALGLAAPLAASVPAQAATCTQTTASGNCPTSGGYADAGVYHDINGSELVAQDVWNTPPNWSTPAQCGATPSCQTLSATDGTNWSVAANYGNPGDEGSVKAYPDTQVTYTLADGTTPPIANFGSTLASSWANIDPVGTGIWEYTYDIWSNPAGTGSWGSPGDEETMIWTDNKGQTPAGSDTGTVYTDPNGTNWEVWTDTGGSSTSSVYSIISFVRASNAQTGSVDLMGFINFEKSHGYMNANASFDQIGYGPEICSTFGALKTFGLTSYSLVKNGSGGGGGQTAPTTVTSPATNVTAAGATLNGTVNPNGAATTFQFDWGTTTAYGNTAGAGSAGSGTSAVPESAGLTGLSPSVTYHYRIEATNSAGTTFGSDQAFTTAASGGGPSVAFDSQGGGSKTGTSPLTWTQTVGTGSSRALLAEASVGTPGSDVGCTQTMTDNGTVMTKLKVIHTNNQNHGFMDIWSWNVIDHGPPPSGVNTLKMTVSGCSSPTLTGTSQSFTGVARLDSVITATGYSSSANVSVTADSGDMVAGFAAAGNSISAPAPPAAHSLIRNVNSSSGAGNSAEATIAGTGSAVTFAWPVAGGGGDWWAAGLMDLHHA